MWLTFWGLSKTLMKGFWNADWASCHGPWSVMFFLKNNHRMALTELPMMATLPFFSATFTTSHPCRTYIRPLLEFILYSNTTNKSLFLSLPLPTSTMTIYHSTTRAPPHSTHVPCHRPIISCMEYYTLPHTFQADPSKLGCIPSGIW